MRTTPAPSTTQPAAGAAESPWLTAQRCLETLRTRGGPAEIGLRIAESFTALGLREPAAIWAQAVAEHVKADPSIADRFVRMAHSLDQLPDTKIENASRIANARRNLDRSLELREQLEPAFDAWAERNGSIAWYRTTDGASAGFDTSVEPTDERWLYAFVNSRAGSSEAVLEPNLPRPSGVPAPVFLHGFSSPWMLRRLIEHYAPLPLGACARILVIEEHPERALDALAEQDMQDVLPDERVRFFLGADAGHQLTAWLGSSDAHWSSVQYYTEVGRAPDAQLAEQIRGLIASQSEQCAALIRSNAAAYDRPNREGVAGESSRRVLIITTRFSTYIQHAARDIASAAERGGATARLIIEPDACSEINGLTIARALNEFRPDLVVQLNYTRAQFGAILPEGLPMVTWVQDAMPHLFRKETGESLGPRDLVVGSIFKEFVTDHAYPEQRCVRFGVPASSEKFKAHAATRPAIEHDMIAATNHAESPERMMSRLERECSAAGMPAGLAADVCERVRLGLEDWNWGWLDWVLNDAIKDALENHGQPTTGPVAACLHRDVANPLANRILRFRALRWAANLARERGYRFRIFGHGWDQDRELGEFAGGALEHGDALRDAYAKSAVTIHAGANWITHQRLYECAMAGGLPAALLRPDDTAHALRHARESLRERGARPTHGRISDRAHCVQASDDTCSSVALSLIQRLATDGQRPSGSERLFEPDLARADGLVPIGKGDLTPAPTIREIPSKLEQLRLIDALSGCMFTDRDSFASLIERAREDREWRSTRSRAIAAIAERSFSYESLVPQILSLATPAV